ncbi:ATP-binding cassette domain-containing protein [Bifidobacterium pseudocatenulatum]|nr:ATP-binding cassette domain-containing protein [Bifidobacterium pseudocatenulatum]
MQGPTNDSSDSAGSQDSNTDNNSPDSQQSGNAQSDASAGKTTMLLLISGLANPTEGKVLCNGSDLSQQDRHPSPCPVFDMS